MMTGGDKLEAYLRTTSDKLGDGADVAVGFFEGDTYPDGTSVAMVAAIQEWGAPSRGIPPRPFMRPTVEDHADEWPDQIAEALEVSGMDAEKALEIMGGVIQREIREAIQAVTSPPLKPATVRRKGFEKPLIDSGRMFQSVKYEVRK